MMEFLIGSKEEFWNFLNSISKENKIGIVTHTDLDGITSALFLEKILNSKNLKVDIIRFCPYKNGLIQKITNDFIKRGITKIFLTDLNIDNFDLDGFRELRKKIDCFLIDHHPISSNLKERDNIIKTNTKDCCAVILFYLGKEIIGGDWNWLLFPTMVSEWSFRNPENLKLIQISYPNVTKENVFDSEPSQIANYILSPSLTYYSKNLKKAYNLIKKKKLHKIKKVAKVINKLFMKNVEIYKNNEEFYPQKKLHFCILDLKRYPSIASAVTTEISKEKRDETFISATLTEDDNFKISARNQKKTQDMGELMLRGIEGLKDATAGGHAFAAAALIKKRDIGRFKENLGIN